jgi:hypothetical protein
MERTFWIGKIDYNNRGRDDCPVSITVKFDGKRFSASGDIWMPSRRDCYACGQIIDEILGYFPNNPIVQKISAIWSEWHLNDMTAGSPAQEAYLKANPVSYTYPQSHYDEACKALEAAGLNPDQNYNLNGKPYRYGTAWLTREIPDAVAAEIESLLRPEAA